jgi:hypothetical protein
MEKVKNIPELMRNIFKFHENTFLTEHKLRFQISLFTIEVAHLKWVEREYFLRKNNSQFAQWLCMSFPVYFLLHLKIWRQEKGFYGRFAIDVEVTDLLEY